MESFSRFAGSGRLFRAPRIKPGTSGNWFKFTQLPNYAITQSSSPTYQLNQIPNPSEGDSRAGPYLEFTMLQLFRFRQDLTAGHATDMFKHSRTHVADRFRSLQHVPGGKIDVSLHAAKHFIVGR